MFNFCPPANICPRTKISRKLFAKIDPTLPIFVPLCAMCIKSYWASPGIFFVSGVFVQVLHNGSDHWITASTVRCKPAEFDSIWLNLTTLLKRSIASLLVTECNAITVW